MPGVLFFFQNPEYMSETFSDEMNRVLELFGRNIRSTQCHNGWSRQPTTITSRARTLYSSIANWQIPAVYSIYLILRETFTRYPRRYVKMTAELPPFLRPLDTRCADRKVYMNALFPHDRLGGSAHALWWPPTSNQHSVFIFIPGEYYFCVCASSREFMN